MLSSSFSASVTMASLSLCGVSSSFYLHSLTVSWCLVILPFRKVLMRLNHRELPSVWVQNSSILTVLTISIDTTKVPYPNCSHRHLVPSLNISMASHYSPTSPLTLIVPPSAPSCPDSQGLWWSDLLFPGWPILLPIPFTVYTPAS